MLGINPDTLLILICIAIIGIIAIIIVKIYYKDEENDQTDEEIDELIKRDLHKTNMRKIPKQAPIFTEDTKARRKNEAYNNVSSYFNEDNPREYGNNFESEDEPYFSESKENLRNNEVIKWTGSKQLTDEEKIASKVFQAPIENKHKEIMENQHVKDSIEKDIYDRMDKPVEDKEAFKIEGAENPDDLKELFTIDKLVQDSKNKEKEVKFSDNVETIKVKDSPISDALKKIDNKKSTSKEIEIKKEKPVLKEERPSPTVKETKTIEEAPKKEEKPKIIKQKEVKPVKEIPKKEITSEIKKEEKASEKKAPTLSKVDTTPVKTDKKAEEKEIDDLDYRKDIEKVKSSIQNSKILKNVKEFAETRLKPPEEFKVPNERYIKNVGSYEGFKEEDTLLREENTRRIKKMNENLKPAAKPKAKKPEKTSLKIRLNSADETLKIGDEIIFTYSNETYSSKILKIIGEKLKVKYRGKEILIKPSDIKKKL